MKSAPFRMLKSVTPRADVSYDVLLRDDEVTALASGQASAFVRKGRRDIPLGEVMIGSEAGQSILVEVDRLKIVRFSSLSVLDAKLCGTTLRNLRDRLSCMYDKNIDDADEVTVAVLNRRKNHDPHSRRLPTAS